ncbi:hypothetical protein [uncultured Stenotrophomonas sp.]|uniref:hypothetical protein n=1 Tax=uncultured Stenotrophomonas sp. TaxID=165438 RepID=UPI0028EEB9F6|nr:hypothetical protein [uncultured Stenotrophomonas sp.]
MHQPEQLFRKRLFYSIGTMFSMGAQQAMVSIALDIVIQVSAAFWVSSLTNGFFLDDAMSDGMTSQAMQQGSMSLILATLILMAAFSYQAGLRGLQHACRREVLWCGAVRAWCVISATEGVALPGRHRAAIGGIIKR